MQLVRWFDRRPAAHDLGTRTPHPWDFSPRLWTRLLILQPTPFCNINCDYCYLPDRSSKARMTLQTVRLAARRLREDGLLGPELTVVWHSGEPMVLPADWYAESISVVREEIGHDARVTHSIQTNATLIDDAWCELIRREGVHIGVSVDGPAELHDRHRRTRSGAGTHAQVMRGISRLKAAGIPFHAIAVVTSETLAAADEFFDFFASVGATELGCSFDEAEGEHRSSSLERHEDAHQRFLERMLDWAKGSRQPLPVRELALAQRLVAHAVPVVHWPGGSWPDNSQVLPWALISVAHDGSFSTFSPELLGQRHAGYGNFVFGSVERTGYVQAASDPAFRRAWQDIVRGVSACERDCAYFAFCGGGSPVNKLYELGDLAGGETLYCRTMLQRPFDLMLRDAESHVARRHDACSA